MLKDKHLVDLAKDSKYNFPIIRSISLIFSFTNVQILFEIREGNY